MTGFDFAPATFAIGFVSLILIALNFRKMRQISFTHTITSQGDNQMIGELPVGVTVGVINTCDNPIIPLYINGCVLIGDKKIVLSTTSISLEKGSERFAHYTYKKVLASLELISDPPTGAEIEQILQKSIKLSVLCSYYRIHLMGKNFIKQEKIYNVIWDQGLGQWSYHLPDEKI